MCNSIQLLVFIAVPTPKEPQREDPVRRPEELDALAEQLKNIARTYSVYKIGQILD